MINSLYSGYRRFCWFWWRERLSPRTYWKWCKWTWQRGRRGWADCDVWGTDSYLCDVIVPMLERLKQAPTYPCPPDAVMDETGQATDAEYKRWQHVWHDRLDEMIAGFRAAQAVMEGPPDRFFTPRTPTAIAADQAAADQYDAAHSGFHQWVSPVDYDIDGAKVWHAEQEAIRKKGFAVFTEYFHALWD